jgi:prepilin-type N-terminal cleavage/methylation domain-containing protein/prepilin-type processing-associated H-X9-DG protein
MNFSFVVDYVRQKRPRRGGRFCTTRQFGRSAAVSAAAKLESSHAWEESKAASTNGRCCDRGPAAFTLLELLVVIAIIGILAALLLPVLSRSKQKAQGTYCLNNGKQLMTAMTLYTGDYHDLFPPNPDDGNSIPGHNWCSGKAGVGGNAEFNADLLKDAKRSLLASYLAGNTAVFHCPGDKRTGTYQGADSASLGKTVAAARTFSMNQAVGTICPGYDKGESLPGLGAPGHAGVPTLPVNGPWLNDERTHRRDSTWLTYGKLSTIRAPGPAMLWVLMDEDVKGLNDAAFAFGMEWCSWIDLPGTYHNGGCGFAFADGHSESHRWFYQGQRQGSGGYGQHLITDPADQRDWAWVRERTSANVNGAMPPPRN